MRRGCLPVLLVIVSLLGAGCLESPPAQEGLGDVSGHWLKNSGEPDILLNLSEGGTAELRFLLDLGIAKTIQVRNGSWEPTGGNQLNLTYVAPLSNGTRVLSLERDGDRLQLVKVWNQTGELEGEMNLSFRHVVGDPGQQFYLGVENPFATRLPA
ncbi:MAG: hypothetical protein AB7S61_01215 [Methanoregulaceae archaeon]